MARRRAAKKAISKGSQIVVIFWLVFIIVMFAIYMANRPTIHKHVDLLISLWKTKPGAEAEILAAEEEPAVIVVEQQPSPPRTETPRPAAPTEPAARPTTEPERPPAQPSRPQTPPQTQTQPQAQPVTPSPVQTRERAVYYTNVGSDGQILHSKVTRRIPVSESPMQDVINILLAGPSAEEVGRGTLNLIPQNTRLLSATVRGNTAYLNFSEDFLFNTFGVEGYVAQLRQIVWTVTEFQNVRDVQILVEGRRMDYLGEGIWIGSPINRQSF